MHWKELEILYEDNHLLMIIKPVGIVVQADVSGEPDLLNLLKKRRKVLEQKPGEAFLGLVHRLDRNVGGVMVFAKTSKAASRLSEQIRNQSMEKTYVGVTEACPPKQGRLEDYLVKDEATNTSSVAQATEPNAKLAQLEYERLECIQDQVPDRSPNPARDYALVKVHLITGRSHQIRVQFSSRGWPLWGDGRYGTRSRDKASIALWSYKLCFLHPVNQQPCCFTAIPPSVKPWNLFKWEGL